MRVGAGRTWSCLEGPCRAQINFNLHDQEYLISRKCVASKAPEAGCRQSISRRRRPSPCSRRCRVPQPWPATAKTASTKLSPSTSTRLETPLRRSLLSEHMASEATMWPRQSRSGATFGHFRGFPPPCGSERPTDRPESDQLRPVGSSDRPTHSEAVLIRRVDF